MIRRRTFHFGLRKEIHSIKHVAIVSATLCNCLRLIYLLLLHTTQRILCSRIPTSGSLCTWNEVCPPSALHIPSCWHSVSKAWRIKAARRVMHLILAGNSSILPSTRQLGCPSLLPLSVSLSTMSLSSLFIDHSHAIKVILSQIQMLSRLVLHLILVVIMRQLLYFEVAWSWFFHLATLLRSILMIVCKGNFRMAYVWADLVLWLALALGIHVHWVYVLWVVSCSLSLSRAY